MTLDYFITRFKYWHKHPALEHYGIAHFECEGISVVEAPFGSDTSCASIRVNATYDDFSVEVRDDWLEEVTAKELDRVSVHELLHVTWRDFDQALGQVFRWTAPGIDGAIESRLDHEKEGIIDRTSRVIVALDYASKA